MRDVIDIVNKYIIEDITPKKVAQAYDRAAKLIKSTPSPLNKTQSDNAVEPGWFAQVKKFFEPKQSLPSYVAAVNQEHEALKTLGLPKDATNGQIKMRYKQLAKKYHPDMAGTSKSAAEQMQKINAAFAHLKSRFNK